MNQSLCLEAFACLSYLLLGIFLTALLIAFRFYPKRTVLCGIACGIAFFLSGLIAGFPDIESKENVLLALDLSRENLVIEVMSLLLPGAWALIFISMQMRRWIRFSLSLSPFNIPSQVDRRRRRGALAKKRELGLTCYICLYQRTQLHRLFQVRKGLRLLGYFRTEILTSNFSFIERVLRIPINHLT